jgi:periplasmic protein TonB
MTTGKEKQRSHRQISANYSLLFYFFVSILIHVLVAILIAYRERSQPTVKEKPRDEPIEFVVVPPEEKPEKPPTETKRRGVNNSVAQGKIRSDKPPATEEIGSTATDSNLSENELQVKSPSTPPVTKTPNLPKPVKPSQPPTPEENNSDRSAIASKPTPSEEEILPQKTTPNPAVATRIPTPQKAPKSPTPPSNSGAASLLGGTYKRSIKDDGGSSFFNVEVSASKEAPYAKVDAQQDDLAPYFDEIRRRVKSNWQPLAPGEERTTTLVFAIQRSGQITGLRILETSGNEQVDRDALEAVQKSAPFDALPQNFKSDRLDIQFNFNIYIY